MGQDISAYTDNIPNLPNIHLLPQLQNLQDILPKIVKLHKQSFKRSNPAYLKVDKDNTDSESGTETDEDEGQGVSVTFSRTRIGSPTVNRRSFTDEEINRFMAENDGFPLPCSEEELKAFDQEVFVECPATTRSKKKKDRERSKSATAVPDLATIRLKLQKIQSPSKPKFLEHLINRVSKKAGRDNNGLVSPVPVNSTEDPVTDEPLSPDSKKCLEVVESLAEELIACTQRPVSGESCDSGQGSSLLESTCDFSPTSKRKSWSTPTSPTFQGIVKQRLKSFQALRETSLPPREVQVVSPRKSSCAGNRELEEAKRFHCDLKQDEKFTKSVMESGYVKALVSKLNQSKSFDKDGNETFDHDNHRLSDDVINGVKVNLTEEDPKDWPDEFSDEDTNEDHDAGISRSACKSPSVKDQLKKFETGSVKSKASIASNNSRKSKKENVVSDTESTLSAPNDAHDSNKDCNKQGNSLNGSVGAPSSSERLTASDKTRNLSETESQVSRDLKRFNHERNKHISSRLCSTSASSSYCSVHNNYIKSPSVLRRPKSSDAAKPNASNAQNGASARYLEKSRSVDLERSSDTASSSPVSYSFDFGLMPLSPEELFDQNWSKSEFTFDDFSDESDHDGISLSKKEEETEEEPKDKLHKIAYELLTTERAYVSRLHLLDRVFHFKVTLENKNGCFVPPEVVTQVFSHIKPIYQFHNDFLLPQLETRMKNWSQEQRIGDIIAKLAPFLKLYTEYVKNFDNSMNLIDKWTNQSPKFASLLQEIQKEPECGQLTLQHHMLGPIQRVPRYELLLKDYIKHLDPESHDKAEAEKALGLVTEAASHANIAIKKIEKFNKLLSILQNLNGEGLNDLVSPTRELVKEGAITKISARSGEKQDRYLFLFNDLLLVCISQLMGKYKVRARLSVDGMMILPGENLAIQNTFCIKCTEKSVEFLDDANNGEGLEWLASFHDVIGDFMQKKKLKIELSDEFSGSKVALADHQELDSEVLGKRAPRWIKDEEVTMCMEYTCQDKFTAFRRRHHCRACGKIFCQKCSSRKVPLVYDNNQLNRVCQKCYGILHKGDNLEDSIEEPPNTPTTPKPVTQIEADQSSVLSCYLNVMDSGKNRAWNRRWITVRDNFVLYFYKKHKDPKAIMTMPLPGHNVKVIDGTEKLDRQHVFALSHKDVNVCYFQTDNDDQLHEWTEVLKKMVLLQLPSNEDKRLSAHSLDSSNSTNSSTGS